MIYLTLIDLSVYFIFLLISGSKANKADAPSPVYEIFTRNDQIKAVKDPLKSSWLPGAVFAGLFILSLPYFVVRYGWKTGGALIVFPLLVGSIISIAIGVFGTMDALFVGAIVSTILRPFIGIYVFKNDRRFVVSSLLKRGWQSVGHSDAVKKKVAINEFISAVQ